MRGYWSLARRLVRLSLPGAGRWSPVRGRRWLLLPVFALLFAGLQVAHWIGFLLDEVFYRGYRRVRIEEPLFVVGLPRSGTSHLQSVLAADPRFTTMRLWELVLAPSVTERRFWLALAALDGKVGRPAGRLVERLQRRGLEWMDEVHPLSLFEPEEDYLLLLPVFACFLLVVPFPDHPAVWELTRFDDWPEAERDAVLDFYESCLKRHLYVVGAERRILSKNPSFTPFALSLAGRFPDSRFVLCVRDPREAVPSLLSSLEDGARFFGYDVARPATRDRFVRMMREFGEHLDRVTRTVPEERWSYARLRDVRADLGGTVRRIYERFGWVPAPEFDEALEDRTRRASGYRSRHLYRAEDYGLSVEELERRFGPLIERLGFHGVEGAAAGASGASGASGPAPGGGAASSSAAGSDASTASPPASLR